MAGRKTKLNGEVIANISNWLKLGYYQEDAAVMALSKYIRPDILQQIQ